MAPFTSTLRHHPDRLTLHLVAGPLDVLFLWNIWGSITMFLPFILISLLTEIIQIIVVCVRLQKNAMKVFSGYGSLCSENYPNPWEVDLQ